MHRVFNFSAGPAALPQPVLEQAAQEMLDWHGSGMSVMEMSHRGKEFMSIHEEALSLLRELLQIPEHYHVLFMQGGAIAENAIVPMNMLRGHQSADYIDTGEWSRRSIQEAQRYARIRIAASSRDQQDTNIPAPQTWSLDTGAAYVHYCANETIGGVEFHFTPQVGAVPLVADMSSNLLSRPIDVSAHGLIYAGAQKNIGPAGLTIVIVRKDLVGKALPSTPTAFDYATVAEHHSMYNTPPTYAIYIAGLVFQWIKGMGGLTAMRERNRQKAQLLYETLDSSSLYRNQVEPSCRSWMNVPFHLQDPRLDEAFLKGAHEAGLVQLKGHRLLGGMRASIYNAMPLEGVQALVDYLRHFEQRRA